MDELVPETIERITDMHIPTIEDTEDGRAALELALTTDKIPGEARLDKDQMKHHYQEKYDLPLRSKEEFLQARSNPQSLQQVIERQGLKLLTVDGMGPRQMHQEPA